MSRRFYILLLAAVLGVAGLVAIAVRYGGESEPHVALISEPRAIREESIPGASSTRDAEFLRLEEEIARLHEEIANKDRELAELSAKMSAHDAANDAAASTDLDRFADYLKDMSPEELWANVEGLLRSDGDLLVYTYDAFWESVVLVMEVAKKGSEGIRFLQEIAARPMPERTEDNEAEIEAREAELGFALIALSLVRHGDALEALLELRAAAPDNESIELESFLGHVGHLPTSEVAPHVPALVDQLRQEAAGEHLPNGFIDLAATMAFRFDDREALRLLQDPRILGNNTNAAANLALTEHSRSARDFVRWVAQNHPNESHRDHAIDVLDSW